MRGRNAISSGPTTAWQKNLRRVNGRFLVHLAFGASMVMGLSWGIPSSPSWAAAGEASEHLSKFLEIPLEGESFPKNLKFPLYEQNNIQYFSAGLGKEERSLSYPPYPLKLIFVKGKRAFLTTVAIEVLHHDGTNFLTIPGEEVQGPWLFLNLPAGKYVIKATDSSGTTLEKPVNLTAKKTATVHFRWP